MKKIFAILLTAALVFCGSSSVFAAAFDYGNLILGVYNSSDVEVLVDLGNLTSNSNWTSTDETTLKGSGTVSLSQFKSGTEWDDLHFSIFTADDTSVNNAGARSFLFGTTSDVTMQVNSTVADSARNGYRSIKRNADDYLTDVVSISATTAGLANITNNMDLGAYGQMAGYNTYYYYLASPTLDGMLTDGFVSLYLYEYDLYSGDLVEGPNAQYKGLITLYADGTITMQGAEATVPVPGAVVLLASGLVGLVGIRRKNA